MGLHVAVLTIGEAGAVPDDGMVVERLRSAGHTIVSRASVDNFVPVVRRQLAAWVSDANIDIVVAVGGGDDNVASSALAPLVTQQLPGFADVFRMLMFQSLGSAAVLAHAEAARCTAKVVFLLPAMADGVALALDKLIVPQLDARTEPYNVARLLPRRTGSTSAAPPMSSSQPGGSINRTMPPPFKKLTTPPGGVKAAPAVEPAAKKPAPAAGDDAKVIVDLDTIGAVVEADDSGSARVAAPVAARAVEPPPTATAAPTSPIEAITALVDGTPRKTGPAKKLSDVDKTFTIRAAESSPNVRMFDKPKKAGLHPVVKGMAALALLAAVGAGAIIVWTHLGLHTQTVSANPPQEPWQPSQPAVEPPQPPQQPQLVTTETVDASTPTEIDVDPATQPQQPQQPAIVPTTPATHPDRPHVPTVPAAAGSAAAAGSGAASAAGSAAAEAPFVPSSPSGPVAADGCDEVSCVLDHYERECCAPFKPKTPENPGMQQDLDRASVAKSIESMKAVVITCGQKFQGKGQVRVHLAIAPDGHVTSADVESSPSAGLGACVAEALRRVQFKHTANGGEVTYPYNF